MIKSSRFFCDRPVLMNLCRTYAKFEVLLAGRKNKRGSMLYKMIDNKDKNKKWHLNFMEKAPRSKSVFEGVHKPGKRRSMLESLFIKNITDVLSTGDISPDILGHGIEINGVKISPCYKTLNVYWQIPSTSYDKHEDIAIALNACAPRLRAELISRNVMGKVPFIFFIRDVTNARIAEFENALKDADLGTEPSVIPDDAFTKDVLVFRVNKKSRADVKEEVKSVARPDIKSDVFGLKHDVIMNKVLASSKGPPNHHNSAVVSSEFFPSAELFDKIPGTHLQPNIDRTKILKQFQIERKKSKSMKMTDSVLEEDVPGDYHEDPEPDYHDFLEDE